MPKTVYGLHRYTIKENGIPKTIEKLIYVDDAENGVHCNCYCENCGGKLIAKQGEVREHHFAHADSLECEGSYEVSIIKKVELILAEANSIALPVLKNVVEPGYKFSYEKAIVEGKCYDSKHHIWSKTMSLSSSKAKLFVEILFSGDYRKYTEKYKEQHKSAISINLKELHDFKPNALKEAVLNSPDYKSWIYNVKHKIHVNNVDNNFKSSVLRTFKKFNDSSTLKSEALNSDPETRARYINKGKEIYANMLKEIRFIESITTNPVCPKCESFLQVVGYGQGTYYSCTNKDCNFSLPIDCTTKTAVYTKQYGDKKTIQLKIK